MGVLSNMLRFVEDIDLKRIPKLRGLMVRDEVSFDISESYSIRKNYIGVPLYDVKASFVEDGSMLVSYRNKDILQGLEEIEGFLE